MSLLPHQAVSSPSNHDAVEAPSSHHHDPIRIVENKNDDDDGAEATFTSIIPAPSSLVSSSSHHRHVPSSSSEDGNHNKDDDGENSIEMDLRGGKNASGNLNSSPSTNNAQQQNAAASSGSTSSSSTSSGTRRSNNYNASNGTNSDDLSQTIGGSSTNFQSDGEDGGTSRRTSTASTAVLYGDGAGRGTSSSAFNSFFNPRQIFALQSPNLALTAPSRRTVLFVFMMTLSFILYICGTFQPLVVADSSYQAARYFDITPRLNAPPSDASSTTKDEGYSVTQWLQCYSNFTKRVLTSTSFRIDTKRICEDPTSDDSAIFCGKAKRLFHASRGFQAFAMISTLLGSILALCSFCGSRSIARYSNRINFTLALLSCLFGLLAIVLATRIVVGSSATCEDRPISMASATVFIEDDSNNNNNNKNVTSGSDEKIFSGGAFLPLTAIAFGLNVVCVVLCLLAGTECLEMKFSVSSCCCCCTSSNENNIDDEQRERRRGTGARRNF